ncbi:MAG: glycosyltransferase family 4 protein [Candidatus Bathyarchaeia archaeon]
MRVNLVCTGFDRSSLILQPWSHVYLLSKKMIEQGVQVTLITDRKADQPMTETFNGLRVHRVEHFYPNLFLRKMRFTKAILKNNPDVIVWFGSPLSAIYLARLKGIQKPVAWVIDNEIYDLRVLSRVSFREMVSPHHRFLWYPLMTALCPRAIIRGAANSPMIRKIVVPSQYLKNSLVKIGTIAKKIVIVPSGRTPIGDSQLEDAKEIKKRARLESDHVILYLGSPCTLRGTDTLVRSVPHVLKEVQNAKLVILSRREPADENSEERYLISLAKKLNVHEHVRVIPGVLGRATLEQLVRSSDIVALPFKLLFNEFPLCILEAMEMGKAIVTTRIGSLVEMIGSDRGVLAEPGRPDSLGRCISYLFRNPKRLAELGRNAERFALDFPSWDEISRRMIDIVYDVASEAN